MAAELQDAADSHDMKQFYNGLKAVYGPKVSGSVKGSKSICDKIQILQHWAEHFETVLNFDDTVLDEIPLWPPAAHLDDPPTMQEVNKAVHQLASDKAPGADCIPAEVFKEGGIKLREHLLHLYINYMGSRGGSPGFQGWPHCPHLQTERQQSFL